MQNIIFQDRHTHAEVARVKGKIGKPENFTGDGPTATIREADLDKAGVNDISKVRAVIGGKAYWLGDGCGFYRDGRDLIEFALETDIEEAKIAWRVLGVEPLTDGTYAS